MPSRPIQSGTAGFLALLELKNTGRNPEVLLDDVRPIVDMTPFYLNGESVILPSTQDTVVAAVGVFNWAQVPENEWWYVHQLFGVLTSAAPAADMGLYVRGEVNGADVIVSGPWGAMNTFTDGSGKAFSQVNNVWAPPGTVLQAIYSGVAGDILHQMGRITRLRV